MSVISRGGQTRRGSLLEALVNIAVGICVAYAGNAILLPLVGIEISAAQNLKITAGFTALSLVRSYALRRVFNWWGIRHETFNHRARAPR